MTVYVIAWRYNTGAGFDWYVNPAEAETAWEKEKLNVEDPELAKENWTAYRFKHRTNTLPSLELTDEINAQMDELMDKAEDVFGPNQFVL